MNETSRFDGPFWGVLLAACVIVGSIACFGLASAASDASHADASLLSTEN